jgi:hypothetical protein
LHHCCKNTIFAGMFNFMRRINLDFMGMATSVVCAIHCAVLPLLITSLPVFGVNIINNSPFEWLMIAIAFMVGCLALGHGYQRHHKNIRPLLVFSAGFIFLISKQLFYKYEFFFLAPAVFLILYAHFLNFRCGGRAHAANTSTSIN